MSSSENLSHNLTDWILNLYRSLELTSTWKSGSPADDSLLKILKQLAGKGYLKNNRKLDAQICCSISDYRNSRFIDVICSMNDLEKLNLLNQELTPKVLAHLFQSCPKLTEVYIATSKTLKMANHLKNQLRSGFQKLRRLHIDFFLFDEDSWSVLQEMLT